MASKRDQQLQTLRVSNRDFKDLTFYIFDVPKIGTQAVAPVIEDRKGRCIIFAPVKSLAERKIEGRASELYLQGHENARVHPSLSFSKIEFSLVYEELERRFLDGIPYQPFRKPR